HSPSGRIPNSDASTGSVAPRLRYRFGGGWVGALDGEIFRAADVGIPVAPEDREIFDGEFRRDDRDRVALRLETPPAAAGLFRSASGAVFYQRQKRNFAFTVNVEDDGGSPNDPNDDVDVFIFDDTTSSIETLGSSLLSRWSAPGGLPGVAGQRLSAGIDLFQDSISDETFNVTDVFVGPGAVVDGAGVPNVDAPLPIPQGPGLVDDRTESRESSVPDALGRSVAGFVQDEMLLPGEVSLFVGGRVDGLFFEANGAGGDSAGEETTVAPSGAAGVVVPILPWVHGVANVARGFRAPNLAERFFSGPGTTGGVIVPNPGLDPETSLNVDAGFKVGHRSVSGAITYFRSDVKDLIRVVATDEAETFTFVNIEDVVLQGVELSGEWRAAPAFTLGANFSYTDEKTSVEDVVAIFPTVAPPASGTLVARYQPPRISAPFVKLSAPYFELRGRLVDEFDDLRG
ncbi:MAG: TonB-dependent receptor plug domain-containing protein, partial [Candidatus Binatia bacterium]